MTKSAIVLRPARAADAEALAQFTVAAGHGVMEVLYGGLVPGQSTLQTVLERRISHAGGFAEWPLWVVAEADGGNVLGGVNAFPHDVFDIAPRDPLIGDDRRAALANLSALEQRARGTYYLNLIAVAPQVRGRGVGALLVAEAERQARAQRFSRLTLSTFAADAGLMRFYAACGLTVIGTAPIEPHPALEHGGDWALLAKDLS